MTPTGVFLVGGWGDGSDVMGCSRGSRHKSITRRIIRGWGRGEEGSRLEHTSLVLGITKAYFYRGRVAGGARPKVEPPRKKVSEVEPPWFSGAERGCEATVSSAVTS